MRRTKAIWLKLAIAVGFALAGLLLVQSFLTHRYVIDTLLMDHLAGVAGDYVSAIERAARDRIVTESSRLRDLLDAIQSEESEKIAWVRIIEQDGTVLAATDQAPSSAFPKDRIEQILAFESPSIAELFRDERVLVVTAPFRFRFPDERTPDQGTEGRPRFKIAEVALFVQGFGEAFRPLREDMATAIIASMGLIVAMLVAVWRFPAYLRGKEIDQQLSVAREVQQQLLPEDLQECRPLQVSASCLPAYDVGGDYFDGFATGDGRPVVVVGDVSGKGLPAALVMSMLHGSVRSILRSSSDRNLAKLTQELNDLIYSETPSERYVTFFWSVFDASTSSLRYVNAGHWPPLLVRASGERPLEIRRLEVGGPPVGLLPMSAYDEGREPTFPGDLLVAYSDGLVEATSVSGSDFGEEGVVETLREIADLSPEEIRLALLRKATEFTAGKGFDDDVTVLVAQVK